MLSEKNHNINLGNYEEYFILYIDNELNAEEKLMVESFLSVHPDLKEELDILLNTKLPMEDFNFSGKEELLSQRMKMDIADESLLLYIDGEAGISEKNKIEQQLKIDRDFQLEYSWLMRAKLDASEIIRYPNKEELYHRTEKVVAIKPWMKIAAAAVIILFATTVWLMNSGRFKAPVVVSINSPKKINISPVIESKISIPVTPNEEVVAKQQVKKEKVPVKDIVNQKENNIPNNDIVPSKNDIVIIEIPKNRKVERIETANKETLNTDLLNNHFANSNVTSLNSTALHITEDPMKEDVSEEPKSNKNAFKGFLRKAARVIERRTGISAENDNNELLIGSVAVKLK